jgi:hypothetical protein
MGLYNHHIFIVQATGSTEVEQMTHNFKIKGSTPAAGTDRERDTLKK